MIAAATLLLAAGVVASPSDREYRAALDLLYDGRPAAAQARLRELEAAHSGDPVPVYLQRGGGRNEYVVLTVPDPKR